MKNQSFDQQSAAFVVEEIDPFHTVPAQAAVVPLQVTFDQDTSVVVAVAVAAALYQRKRGDPAVGQRTDLASLDDYWNTAVHTVLPYIDHPVSPFARITVGAFVHTWIDGPYPVVDECLPCPSVARTYLPSYPLDSNMLLIAAVDIPA